LLSIAFLFYIVVGDDISEENRGGANWFVEHKNNSTKPTSKIYSTKQKKDDSSKALPFFLSFHLLLHFSFLLCWGARGGGDIVFNLYFLSLLFSLIFPVLKRC